MAYIRDAFGESNRYETMPGEYNPETWKEAADWFPHENNEDHQLYLQHLKQHVKSKIL